MKLFTIIFLYFINLNILIARTSVINSVSPAQNLTNANIASDITIVFNEDMSVPTLIPSNIKVLSGLTGLVNCAISFSSSTKTLTINPSVDFKYGDKITVSLNRNIQNLSGENITQFVYTFRTEVAGGNADFIKTYSIPGFTSAEVQCADLNKDGNTDLVVNNKIYLNNGIGIFSYQTELGSDGKPQAADFNNDGWIDILIQTGNTVSFYKNSNGTFNFLYQFNAEVGSHGDLNGDGFPELTSYISDFTSAVFINNNGHLEPDTTFTFPGIRYRDKNLIADMNNDGIMDIVTINGSIGYDFFYYVYQNYYVFYNNENMMFDMNYITTTKAQGVSSISLWLGGSKAYSFRNNGLNDIVSPSFNLFNNGNGSFTVESEWIFSHSTDNDFNGDGLIDLALELSPLPVRVLLNNGEGGFEIAMSYERPAQPKASTDIDNDGDIDLVVFDIALQEISILKNSDEPSPVELASFTSSVNNSNDVRLDWTTSGELNNSGFDVERKDGSSEWRKISFIHGSGTTNEYISYQYTDENLNTGKYQYRLKQIDLNGNYEYFNLQTDVMIEIPVRFSLSQNYPNPFNPSTILSYEIPEDAFVRLAVFDNTGREISILQNEQKIAGYYRVNFDGSQFSSGVYFYKIEAGDFVVTKKMVLVR